MTYVAYVHARPNTTTAAGIFYVGKGTRKRANTLVGGRRSPHHQNIVAKHGRETILVGQMECSSESVAFELEKGLIKCLRRMGVGLVNISDGGDGPAGAKRTPEMNARNAEAQRARDPATRARGYTRTISPETKAKLRSKMLARDPEVYARVSDKLKGRPRPDEVKFRIAETTKGRVVSPETKAKLVAAWERKKARGFVVTDETKAAMRSGHAKRKADK